MTSTQGELLVAESSVGGGEDTDFSGESISRGRQALRIFLHNRVAMPALILYVVITVGAYVAPYFYKWKFDVPDTRAQVLQVDASVGQAPGKNGHLLGTDQTGFDLVARMMRGTQRDFEIAVISLAIALVIGIAVGALAGYYGKLVDNILMRFVDLLLTIPVLVILIVAADRYPNVAATATGIAVLLGLFGWMYLARLLRGQFLSLREREFVEAAHAMGAKDSRIIFKHLIPNSLGTILVFSTLFAATTIIAETSLTYLGYGVKAPDTSLGLLISNGVDAADTRSWLFYYPGILVLVIVLATNLIGEGVRDAFDPKHNRVRD